MSFCFELDERQSARVIEQAIRGGVPVRLEPHHASTCEPFGMQMIDAESECLVFRFAASQAEYAARLVPGQICQAQFSVAGGIHTINVHVLEIDLPNNRMRTSRPEAVQILERRRFVRAQLAGCTKVQVRWLDRDRSAETILFNIGGGGLALRIGRGLGDEIHVGDLMEATFELPGLPRRFQFKISICNKTVASDEASVIVGVQFEQAAEDGKAGELDELRRFLATQQQTPCAR